MTNASQQRSAVRDGARAAAGRRFRYPCAVRCRAALKPSAEFDRGYVRVVGVEDHMANIALFEKARREARDRDLRAWIDKTLPLLRADLGAAKSLSGSLAG